MRWCVNCQSEKPEDQGKFVVTGKIKRWKCNSCLKKISKSVYKSVPKI